MSQAHKVVHASPNSISGQHSASFHKVIEMLLIYFPQNGHFWNGVGSGLLRRLDFLHSRARCTLIAAISSGSSSRRRRSTKSSRDTYSKCANKATVLFFIVSLSPSLLPSTPTEICRLPISIYIPPQYKQTRHLSKKVV